ncbi:MAG TPA: hypothetical protein VN040_14015 [Pseudosphingobacterium sp.]|nr:hypothetical protein [Pseudosphingobacterium sp.]
MMGTFAVILFIVLTLVLMVYMLIKEKHISSRVPWWLRGVAVCVAAASLAGLAFPIHYQRAVTIDSVPKIHVLTRGVDEKLVDRLISLPDCYTTDIVLAKKRGIPFIEDWSSWLATHRNAHFSIYGFGVSPEQLRSLDRNRGDYQGAPPPRGLVFADWDQEINRGSYCFLRGIYRPVGDGETKLYLMSAGQPVDSTTLQAGKENRFELNYLPKQEGKTVLHIAVVEGGDTLQYEKVALMVQPPRAYAVSLLGASPSAEYKFLYNWLLANHYQVSYRARISKEKFLYVGTGPATGNRSSNLIQELKSTDLLFIDEAEWVQLTNAEQQGIERALAKGMGIILMGDEGSPRSKLGRLFRWKGSKKGRQQMVSVRFRGEESFALDLLVSDLVSLVEDEQVRPLIYADGNLAAATRLQGAGHITALSLNNSYNWWLQGKGKDYAKFWSKLLSLTLPDKKEPLAYVQSPRLPIPYQWTKLVLKDLKQHTVMKGASWRVSALSDPWIPTNQSFSFWPEESGWNKVLIEKDTIAIYAYDETDWRPLRDEERMTVNKNYFLTAEPDSVAGMRVIEGVEVPKWIFCLLFFVSAGVLWCAWRDYN